MTWGRCLQNPHWWEGLQHWQRYTRTTMLFLCWVRRRSRSCRLHGCRNRVHSHCHVADHFSKCASLIFLWWPSPLPNSKPTTSLHTWLWWQQTRTKSASKKQQGIGSALRCRGQNPAALSSFHFGERVGKIPRRSYEDLWEVFYERNHKQSGEVMSVEAEVKEQCCAWAQQGSSREMAGEG